MNSIEGIIIYSIVYYILSAVWYSLTKKDDFDLNYYDMLINLESDELKFHVREAERERILDKVEEANEDNLTEDFDGYTKLYSDEEYMNKTINEYMVVWRVMKFISRVKIFLASIIVRAYALIPVIVLFLTGSLMWSIVASGNLIVIESIIGENIARETAEIYYGEKLADTMTSRISSRLRIMWVAFTSQAYFYSYLLLVLIVG